jgi:drug/metabolite transporter (DMT)-like permease
MGDWRTLSLLLTSIVFAAGAQISLRAAVVAAGQLSLGDIGGIAKALFSTWAIFGILLFGLAIVTWVVGLSRTTLSYAYPFTALTFVLVLAVSWLFLKEPVTITGLSGVLLIVIGLVVASR